MNNQPETTTPERLLELAVRVLQRTEENKLDWKETGGDAFFTRVGDYLFQIESEDGDGNHPYRIQVETPDFPHSEVLTSLSTGEELSVRLRPDWKDVVQNLYNEARKRGSSAERALNEMLDALADDPKKEDDIPF
jgi:hypothetical protein